MDGSYECVNNKTYLEVDIINDSRKNKIDTLSWIHHDDDNINFSHQSLWNNEFGCAPNDNNRIFVQMLSNLYK